MRARASSLRLPFSTPLLTRGMGMSRCTHTASHQSRTTTQPTLARIKLTACSKHVTGVKLNHKCRGCSEA